MTVIQRVALLSALLAELLFILGDRRKHAGIISGKAK